MSEDGSQEDRRRFRRTDRPHPVEIQVLDAGESTGDGATVAGDLVNVGCGGVLIRAPESLEVGDRCRVRFRGASEVEPYTAEGTVRRTDGVDDAWFIGIQFDERLDVLRTPVGAGGPSAELLPRRVLVVDDEVAIRNLLGSFLASRGYDVDTVGTGEEALAALRQETPEILVLDIRMPGMSGLEVLRRIREEGLTVGGPIWVISGYASDEEAREALRLGASDFINKPLDLQYLDWSLRLQRMAT